MWICYRHHQMLRKFWRSSRETFQYPGHSGDKKYVRGRTGVKLKSGGGIAKKFGWGCAVHSLKRLPFSHQVSDFPHPISDLLRNCFCLRRRFRRASNFRYYSKHTSQKQIIIKKQLLLKTIPNSRPYRRNITLFQIKMVQIYAAFQSKTARKQYPLVPHIPIQLI